MLSKFVCMADLKSWTPFITLLKPLDSPQLSHQPKAVTIHSHQSFSPHVCGISLTSSGSWTARCGDTRLSLCGTGSLLQPGHRNPGTMSPLSKSSLISPGHRSVMGEPPAAPRWCERRQTRGDRRDRRRRHSGDRRKQPRGRRAAVGRASTAGVPLAEEATAGRLWSGSTGQFLHSGEVNDFHTSALISQSGKGTCPKPAEMPGTPRLLSPLALAPGALPWHHPHRSSPCLLVLYRHHPHPGF